MKKRKFVAILAACCLTFSIPVAAVEYGFHFSFITGSAQVGGEGTKSNGDTKYSLNITNGSLSTTKYITAYVRDMNRTRISEYATINKTGITITKRYKVGRTNYSSAQGRVQLLGNTSAIGAVAHGVFSP